MRQSILTFLLLFGPYTHLSYANVDAQIEAIKNAPVEERFKLMNAFKKNLIKMKEDERMKAMSKLTSKSNSKHTKKALDELKQHTKRKEIQNRIEHHHMDDDNVIDASTDQEGGENDD